MTCEAAQNLGPEKLTVYGVIFLTFSPSASFASVLCRKADVGNAHAAKATAPTIVDCLSILRSDVDATRPTIVYGV